MVMIVLGMLLTSVSNIFFIVGKRAGYHYVYIKMNMKQAPTAIAGACFVLVLFYFASGSKDNGCVPNIVVKLLTLKRYALLEKSRVTS